MMEAVRNNFAACLSLPGRIAGLIAAGNTVEKVYLLGQVHSRETTTSIFNPAPDCAEIPRHIYLLVLVPAGRQKELDAIQDHIEHHPQLEIPVTALVFTTQQFGQGLAAGQVFACRVLEHADLLFDTGIALPAATAVNREEWEEKNRRACARARNLATEFLAGAELYRLRRQNAMAAFMLHQSAEQALAALVQLHLGLRVTTHNLDKLLRYAGMALPQLQRVLSANGIKGADLLAKLQHAYIDTRYKEYSIQAVELLELEGRIGQLIGWLGADA